MKSLGILFFLSITAFIIRGQPVNKNFLVEGVNTIPDNLQYVNGYFYIVGDMADTTTSPLSIKSFIAKADALGNFIYFTTQRPDTLHHFVAALDFGKSYLAHNDILASGYASSTFSSTQWGLIIKYDTAGNMIFWTLLPTQSAAYPIGRMYISTCANNSYYTGGTGYLFDAFPMLSRTDTFGNFLWSKVYNTVGCCYKLIRSIIPLDSGNLMLVCDATDGTATDENIQMNTLLIKVDSLGNELWHWEDNTDSTSAAYSFQPTDDGGYISCGINVNVRDTTGNYYNTQGLVTKWNADFSIAWQTFIPPVAYSGASRLYDIAIDAHGNFIACGYGSKIGVAIGSPGMLVKLDPTGNILWQRYYKVSTFSANSDWHELYDLSILPNGDIVAVGQVEPTEPGIISQQGWLIKVDSNGCLTDTAYCGYTSIEIEQPTNQIDLQLYPNPVSEVLQMDVYGLHGNYALEIWNSLGQKVYNKATNQVHQQKDVQQWQEGLYVVRLKAKDGFTITKKIIKQ